MMPKVIGPVSSDRWEREVRRQFIDQLPKDWVVVCNVSWSVRVGDYVRDGQSDFVVLIPGLGMVIAEVKGSRGIRISADGCWYRQKYTSRASPSVSEERLDEPHTDQATSNMHQLASLITKALNLSSFPGSYAFVVIYPNGEILSMPTLLDATTIISKKNMNDLGRRLRSSLIARGGDRAGARFTVEVCNQVARTLSKQELSVVAVDTELEALDDDQAIDQLTRQQSAALKGVFELHRVGILGPAGSGKTLLAIWKLKALLEEGKRCIYVCFNKTLAEFLKLRNPDCAESIISVDGFFHGIANPRPWTGDQNAFFSEHLPQLVIDKAMSMDYEEKFDAILIDEGQDFGEFRAWALFDLLRSKDSQWIFFADWNQDIYKTRTDAVFGAEVVFNLYHNCRNTEKVTIATNQYCDMHVEPLPGSPAGEKPIIEFRSTHDSMAMRAWEIINELQPQGGAVILSPFKLENSCMARTLRGHGLELTQDISKLGSSGYVLFSTIKSFKGLEGSLVVLVQAEQPGLNHLTLEDLYVACTRPRSRLAILTSSDQSKEWFARHLH